uniref:Uncharacterized protein n=1 Tax=Aegilops tauschii subsp. strangulata TaxID=200361 RepID=A0A453IGB4_AEGTS
MRSALGLSHWCSLLLLLSLVTAPRGLEVGDLFSQGKPPAVKQDCSRTCESKFCTVPPVLRYGKYCGILYSGCPGEKPCDALDACCMVHDHCVAANNSTISSPSSTHFSSSIYLNRKDRTGGKHVRF